jgi:hypothetical protein
MKKKRMFTLTFGRYDNDSDNLKLILVCLGFLNQN